MADFRLLSPHALMAASALALLAGCSDLDVDLRGPSAGGTAVAARMATAPRPDPDRRGVISYPSFQVAVARRGDTVADVAGRVGLPPDQVADYNGLPLDAELRDGEVVALPKRVAEPVSGQSAGASVIRPAQDDQIDVAVLANDAIDRAESDAPANPPFRRAEPAPRSGPEPVQHQVARGETAYSIARLYGVSVRSLADWNGLGADLGLREGQYLMIPVVAPPQQRTAAAAPAPDDDVTAPGEGSPTPVPPSASQPLPPKDVKPQPPVAPPPSPELAEGRTEASKLLLPVQGSVIREYRKGRNDGIDIAAAAGTEVMAAEAGTVAAITRDTDQIPILVLRHKDNLLTVYANIDGLKVKKGDTVKRGQPIAEVREGNPSFLHFEVREGFESADPINYVN